MSILVVVICNINFQTFCHFYLCVSGKVTGQLAFFWVGGPN